MARTGMTQSQIRDKAIEFAVIRMRKDGFEKVRFVDIAKDLGVSHAALYGHFADKAALLDAVSERWLRLIDESQEVLCQKKIAPLAKIHAWFMNLHQMKRQKVLNDPELYKAFDLSSEEGKPFVRAHLETAHRQLFQLVNEAISAKKIRKGDPESIARILFAAMTAFTHPKLVAQNLHEKREPLLRQILDTLLGGLR